MGKRLDSMETWGVEAIPKEAARLLHKHCLLFLPFYLAFYLPISIAGIFQTVFLAPSATPLHYALDFASFIKSIFTSAQARELGTDTVGGQLVPTIVFTTLFLVVYVLGTLGVAAVAYIVAYIYSNDDSDDDHIKVQKVFKLLPHAFLRMLVTQLWTVSAMVLLLMVCGIIYTIMSAVTGWSDSPLAMFSVVALSLGAVAASISLIIMFAFAQFIAVLEPEKYGREALKRSAKLVKAGGAGAILPVLLVIIIYCSVVWSFPGVTGTLPLWKEIILRTFVGILNSVVSAYLGVVSVVMYFVYTSRFVAVSSSNPEFQRGSTIASAENLYKPLVPGHVYTTSVS